MTRIWMNHWFSTAYNIISLLKQGEPDFCVIGTNEREYPTYRAVCDEFYTEPKLDDEPYVAFCLDFCRAHEIDVFMPRRHFLAVSRHIAEFEAIGVRVMVDAYERILPLNRKSEAYAMLADCPEIRIPEYRLVTNVTQFQEAVEYLKGNWKQVCFKFEQDEGGRSFRLLDETPKGYHALFKKQSATRMNYAAAVEALSEVESFPPMIVMPYLPDDEISADCLNTQDGLIIIPRIKNPTRTELVRFPEDVLEMCRAFHRRCPLEMPYNIQFKYLDGIPYFLEVNTRMSGGVQMACAAAGVNIPNIAVNKLLGVQKPWNIRTEERYVTHVETPIVF